MQIGKLAAGAMLLMSFLFLVVVLSGCSAGTHVSGPLGTIETGVSVGARPPHE